MVRNQALFGSPQLKMTEVSSNYSMIPKSGDRFSGKITLKQEDKA